MTLPDPSLTPAPSVTIGFDRRSVIRASWGVLFVVVCAVLGRWVFQDAGGLVFTLVMSWLASIAMEPAVSRLAKRMRRGLASMLVLLSVVIGSIIFLAVFGSLLADQLTQFLKGLPGIAESVITWSNNRFGTKLDAANLLDTLRLTPDQIRSITSNLAGGLLGVLVTVLNAVFSTFTFGLFTFYFSADGPRVRTWISRLFPPKQQEVFVLAWKLAIEKAGAYVAARLVLAGISGSLTAVFLLVIGMPYWLPLGIWTGIVAQFVPTIGTYIAIALPVLIGLVSPEPIKGVLALGFALVYQQIENLTIEPRISAKAVDVHPAVSFASVILGASLFGVAGALVAVPVVAIMLSLLELYARKYEVAPE